MRKLNTRKLAAMALISMTLGSMTIAFQNFTANETDRAASKKEPSLNDAISAALKTAEADTTAKQLALNVEPMQIEKESLKKHRKPSAIVDQTETLTEVNPTWVPKDTETHHEVEDTIDTELNDVEP